MPLFTFGGGPEDVLTDSAGNVVTNYAVLVKAAGTGATVSALYEADGTTPIAALRSNPAGSDAPGAVRTFKTADVSEIEIEYNGPSGSPVKWYRAARELSAAAYQAAGQALTAAESKLDKATTDPQTVSGPVTFSQPISAPGLGDQSAARWFVVTGATGDGVADDRAKIQAQLDAARDAGGGIVFLPPGRTYGVSTFLVVYDRTTVWAYGATIKAVGTTGLLRNFLSSETFGGYSGHSHIQVLGGIWDGNAADAGVGTVTGMTNVVGFVHCSDITVRDVTIRNVSSAHALEFNSTDGGKALNCRFEGFKDNSGDGSRGFAEAVQIDLAKSGSSSIGLFDNTPSRNIVVSGCYFGPSLRLGPPGRAVGSHTTAAGVYYDNIQVVGNRINGAVQEGIHGYGWRRAVIADNIITGTGMAGIKYTGPDPATAGYTLLPDTPDIHGNVIDTNATEGAVQVMGYATALIRGVTIHGNTVRSSGNVGLRADYCTGPVFTGNVIDTTASTGLLVQYGRDATVSGNSLRDTASNAINMSGCVGGAVTGNTVNTTGANFGVFVGAVTGTASTDMLVSGNMVTAAASAGIRLSTGAVRCTVTGNKVRKGAGATANGISIAADATACWVAGNDFSGNSWAAAAAIVAAAGANPKLDFAGGTTSPGHNLIG
ncbi:right-handed parallel beta-helix repeat-containing protein [Streptomyces hirsutus]|uniref:right-handed parallel beta-helix repeat-containing protein n=1 Tax=Streptomyces hirsutus TaxID=35620 RepID=UPI0036590798